MPALQKTALLLFAGQDDAVCPVEDHFFPLYRKLRSAPHPRLDAHVLNTGHGLDRAGAMTMHQMTADSIVRTFPTRTDKTATSESSATSPKLPRQ